MSNYRNDEMGKLVDIFQSLANANRLQLFLRLSSCCKSGQVREEESNVSMCASQLAEGLDIAPSTLSHHLKELRRAGLIRMERRGRVVDCRVDEGTLRKVIRFFATADNEKY